MKLDVSSTEAKDDSSTATKDDSSTATKDDSSTATKDDSSTATKDDSSTATKDDSSTATKDVSSTAVKDMLKQSHTTVLIEIKWCFRNQAQLVEMLRYIASMVEEGHIESEYPEWKLIIKL